MAGNNKNKKPYIILSNDDGIRSAGLKALYNAVSGLADVLVVAPSSEKSGASHSLSIYPYVIKVKKINYYGATAYSVAGTPADCAKIALHNLVDRRPDIFISGINHGPNIAQFILYSGTIGAAAEAAILGLPSMAFSINTYEPADFSFAEKLIGRMVKETIKGKIKIKKHALLNVNFPDRPGCKIKGIKVLPTGKMDYAEKYVDVKKRAGENRYYRHMITGRTEQKRMTDTDGVEQGYVTITPIDFDLNDYGYFKKVKKMAAKIRMK